MKRREAFKKLTVILTGVVISLVMAMSSIGCINVEVEPEAVKISSAVGEISHSQTDAPQCQR